ncbi:MAG: fumarate hydratase subunit alpha [Fusobacteria bacterium]|nr:MAG: fumarate hydratase subunit alpha [Fusobacteriota bacterium]KAF0229850.1 MAG: fumarate hydratase subunit [Fusobacteriota bacterium]
MKKIKFEDLVKVIRDSVIEINCVPSPELISKYNQSIENEDNILSKQVLLSLKENALIAKERMIPICQDTGTAVFFIEYGTEINIDGGFIYDAIYEGVRLGYQEGYLRKSIVDNPLNRKNTGNNLPPIIHTKLIEGENLNIVVLAKGAGSENMSSLKMMTPSDGIEGIKNFVLETVVKAGPNPCPPITVGVGVGSNFEGVALLAKKALVKDLFETVEDDLIMEIEADLKMKLNELNIGPQGFGGKTSVFDVAVMMEPCHIASMPVAVNINCHVIRHKKIIF